MVKKLVILMLFFLFLMTGLLTPLSVNAAEFPELKYTIAHSHPTTPDDDIHYFCTQFVKYVTEVTGDKITFDIVGDTILGGESELLESIGLGTIDIVPLPNVTVSSQSSPHEILAMPFLFKDFDDVHRFLDSEIMAELNESIITDCKAKVLAMGDGGFRYCLNNVRPIKTLEDFKGLKLRVMESALPISMFKLLGANPTPMVGGEVFAALQQGTIDGLEQPVTTLYSMQHWTVAKYLDMTGHQFTAWYLLMNIDQWNKLSAELQAIFLEAAAKAAADQRKAVIESEEKKIEIMATNVIVNRNVDTSGMREAVKPLYQEYRGIIGEEIFGRALKFLGIE